MMREEISEARTKKLRTNRKMPLRRWQARTRRLMSNRKQILKGKSGDELPLLRLAPSRLRRRLPATFSNDSLEYTANRRRRQRRRHPTAGVEHDELPIRTIAAGRISSSTSDRATFSVL